MSNNEPLKGGVRMFKIEGSCEHHPYSIVEDAKPYVCLPCQILSLRAEIENLKRSLKEAVQAMNKAYHYPDYNEDDIIIQVEGMCKILKQALEKITKQDQKNEYEENSK